MGSLDNYVTLQITRDSVGVARAGFGIPLILSATAAFSQRLRYYGQLSDISDDGFTPDDPEYLAAAAMFAQNPCPPQVAIGRSALPPTQRYAISIPAGAVTPGRDFQILVSGSGVTTTTVEYTTGSVNQAITTVTNASDLFTKVAHGLLTSEAVRVTTSGGLPTGLAVDTDYYVIRVDADTFKLASSAANALSATPVNITSDGTGTLTVSSYTNDLTISQLVNALNVVAGANYTAAIVTGAGDTDTMTVTATSAGAWFSLEVLDVTALGISQTHTDPGVATDLAAISREQPNWYALVTLYNSQAYVLGAAAWVEANKRVYLADVNETNVITLASTGTADTLDRLHTLNYGRTMGLYHPRPSAMFAAAWEGRVLPEDAGSEVWALKTLSGVEAVNLTSTHRANIVARQANCYETVANLNVTFEGTTADGEYMDVRRGLDWLDDDMRKSVFEVLAAGPKVPYTNRGIARVQAAMRGSLKRAVARGVLSDDVPFTITVPKVADISSGNKSTRLLPDMKFSGTLAGAIQKVDLRGVVAV